MEPETYAWVAHLDVESQNLYYYNETTDVTQSDPPTEPIKPFWVARFHETQQAFVILICFVFLSINHSLLSF